MEKIPVYMMPGLAASSSIFDYIKLPERYDIHYMHWIIPNKNESLSNYVDRLIETQINHNNPVLLGVSFGGIVVQEIAKKIHAKKIILISTVKSHDEFPSFFNWSLQYRLYKLFPSKVISKIDFLEKIPFSTKIKQKIEFYKRYLAVNDTRYMNWAIKTVLTWKQSKKTENFIHIHGTKDHIFPIKNIQQPITIIEKGRHDMVIVKARKINKVIANFLNES